MVIPSWRRIPLRAPSAAIDIYLVLVLPDAYRTLVLERGWTADRYEAWLAGALVQQLLHGGN